MKKSRKSPKKSPLQKQPSASGRGKRVPNRLAVYQKLNRKEKLLFATYGPSALKNPTFALVLEYSRSQQLGFNQLDCDYETPPKETLFEEFKKSLRTHNADFFRDLAASLESIARAEGGIYHDRVALELLKSHIPPEDAPESLRAIWGSDLVTRKDILERAGRKVYGSSDGQFRNVDRLAKGLDVVLGKAKEGRKPSRKKN